MFNAYQNEAPLNRALSTAAIRSFVAEYPQFGDIIGNNNAVENIPNRLYMPNNFVTIETYHPPENSLNDMIRELLSVPRIFLSIFRIQNVPNMYVLGGRENIMHYEPTWYDRMCYTLWSYRREENIDVHDFQHSMENRTINYHQIREGGGNFYYHHVIPGPPVIYEHAPGVAVVIPAPDAPVVAVVIPAPEVIDLTGLPDAPAIDLTGRNRRYTNRYQPPSVPGGVLDYTWMRDDSSSEEEED
jgi:hypothetical protein